MHLQSSAEGRLPTAPRLYPYREGMLMPQLVDCHTHTLFSDGKATFRQNMRAAVSAGLATIACTDHLAHPAFMDCAIAESRLDEYAAEIRHMREEFPQLEIVHGFEADWYPGCEADIAATRGSATFLLGSIHYLDEFAIDWDEDMRAWEEWGADGVWHRYVDSWCEACFCPARFDSMAHPDLPRLMEPAGYAPTIALVPLWDRMAEAAHDAGVHVELSTAALRKNLSDYYPAEGLLRRFCQAGVPLTVGSDSHEASSIGFGIAEAYAHAARIGYRSIDVPTVDGGWRTIALD